MFLGSDGIDDTSRADPDPVEDVVAEEALRSAAAAATAGVRGRVGTHTE